jgi:high-affinity iron transporter
MWQAFVITFREGLEAFLIVGATVAVLRHTGHSRFVAHVTLAMALSPVTSAMGAAWLSRVTHQTLTRAALALAAAGAVLALGMSMRHMTRAHVRSVTLRWAVAACALLIVTREGLEMALLLAALVFQVRALDVMAGAVLGGAVSAALAWCWAQFGHRLDRGRLARATAVLIAVLLAQLLVHGLLDLTEANVLPGSLALYTWLEPWGPDGRYGQYVSYLLALAPLTALAVGLFLGDDKASDRRVAHVDR